MTTHPATVDVDLAHVDVVEQLLRITSDPLVIVPLTEMLHVAQRHCRTRPDSAALAAAIGEALAGRAGGSVPAGSPVAVLTARHPAASSWRSQMPHRPRSAWARYTAAAGRYATTSAPTCRALLDDVIDTLDADDQPDHALAVAVADVLA